MEVSNLSERIKQVSLSAARMRDSIMTREES
jgi:hypothetical protein